VNGEKQLPKLELRTNIPERLGFPYGDAKYLPSKKEGWAPQYLITVESEEGQMMAWFASETVWNKLLEAGVGKGGVADVTKGEVKGGDGKMRTEWIVDVIDPGVAVANPVRGGPAAAQAGALAGAVGAGAFYGAPGTRPGAEGYLGELGAAYAACIDEAKAVWLRSSHGIAGKLDYETVHSTASVFMISMQRTGFDLSPFASTYAESDGLRALRKLIDRVRTEPYLADVREHFGEGLDRVPPDAGAQRSLYAALKAAVKTATSIAAENTPAPAATVDDEELPFDTSDLGPVPDTGRPPKISGNKAAPKPDPAFLAELIEKAIKVWEDKSDEGLRHLSAKVTRQDTPPEPRDLTDAQAAAIIRSLDNMLVRMKK
jgi:hypothetical protein